MISSWEVEESTTVDNEIERTSKSSGNALLAGEQRVSGFALRGFGNDGLFRVLSRQLLKELDWCVRGRRGYRGPCSTMTYEVEKHGNRIVREERTIGERKR